MMRSLAAAAALVLAMAAGPAWAEEYVVIESSVAALAAGATVAADAALELGPNDRVVLIAASGRVVTLHGPLHGPPPAAAPGASQPGQSDILKVLPTLLGQKDQRQQIGAVRALPWSSDAIKTPADALAVNATDGGDMCVYDPRHAELIHDPKTAGVMTVQSLSNGAHATLTWDKDTLRQSWPAAMPPSDGDLISFDQSGAQQAALATIHLLPPPDPAAGDVARAVQLAQAGCDAQARALLAVIAQAAQ